MSTNPEARSRLICVIFLLLLGGWVLHSYLPLLIWAVVLAISTWPVYRRLLKRKEQHGKVTWSAVLLTLLMGTVILAPAAYGLGRLLDEAQTLVQFLTEAQSSGIPPPAWLETLPKIGPWAKKSWQEALGTAEAAKISLHWLGNGGAMTYTKDFAGQILNRFISFLMILLVLLFVYQHGDSLGRQTLACSRRLFGDAGARYTLHATAAVRATVNGMMLIGIAKGVLLGFAYSYVGLSHPAILGALTGIFAMIPFAAKLIFGACSLVLVAQGHGVEAAGLFIYGMVLTLFADNYVRPILIGGAVKLPFIWTLLGIFGGMETFGLLGLFLGPALMAVLITIWRDWTNAINSSAEQ
jgi:predicted PurR-regulated permease PerM